MTNEIDSFVKIRFEVDDPDSDHCDIETVWAKPLPNGYKISNIPFCAYGVACGDIVEAQPAEDGMLEFQRVLQASGNSVVRLVHFDETRVPATREQLREMGCWFEQMGRNLLAVEVPASVDYARIRSFLDERSAAGVLDFEEACLGFLPLDDGS